MITYVPHLGFFGFTSSNKIKLTVKNIQGKEEVFEINMPEVKQSRRIFLDKDSTAYCWNNVRKMFTYKYFEDDTILYVQYNKCWSQELERLRGVKKRAKEMPSFSKLEKDVLTILKEKPVEKLIFDMRFNGGGASRQGTNFIKKLAEVDRINKKGKLFVIIGRHTFSSAVINTLDFKRYTNVIFIGEATGGKPNHYGELKKIILPNSGLKINYSTKYFNNYKLDTDAFYPDIKMETSFLDFVKGVDPIFEYIKGFN